MAGNMAVRVINRSAPFGRVETGAIKFRGDWAGLFVRGDDCVYLKQILEDCRGKNAYGPFVDALLAAIDEAHVKEQP